jgi:environmental stress-induced protein Ves
MLKVDPSRFQVMPWKNGGGTTTQLVIEPPGAGLEGDFLWRISRAQVGCSGPFSLFPGVDRTLLILAGEGMVLDHGPWGTQTIYKELIPVSFPGEWPTQGTLRGGPVEDFNVMSRRGRMEHRVEVLRDTRDLPVAHELILHAVQGKAWSSGECLEAGEVARIPGGGGRLDLAPGSVVLLVVLQMP